MGCGGELTAEGARRVGRVAGRRGWRGDLLGGGAHDGHRHGRAASYSRLVRMGVRVREGEGGGGESEGTR